MRKNKIVSPLCENSGFVTAMMNSMGMLYARLESNFLIPSSIPQNRTPHTNETPSSIGCVVNIVMKIIAMKYANKIIG